MFAKYVCTAAICLNAGAVLAADLPLRPTFTPSTTPFPLDPPSWAGFYAGVHLGYGSTLDDKVGIHHLGQGGWTVRNVGGNLTPGGLAGGIQVGYNWQSGAVVFGIEADGSWLSGKSSFSGVYPAPIGGIVTTSASKGAAATLRTRLGYAFGNVLLYGTGGLSVTQVKYMVAPAGGVAMSATNARLAPVMGGGVEYAFDSNWTARIEGLYTHLGARRLPATVAPGGQVTTIETQSHWLARVGVNYRFGGGAPATAIAARF